LAKRAEELGRKDDTAEVIKVRLDTYAKETRPVVDHFKKTKNIVHINSERSVEMVFKQICAYVDLLVRNIEVRLPEVIFFSGGVGSGKNT